MNRSVSKTSLVEHTSAVLEKYGIQFAPGTDPDAKGRSDDDVYESGHSEVHSDKKDQPDDGSQKAGQSGVHPDKKEDRKNSPGHKPWVVGVSGGPDSMVLLHILSSGLHIPTVAAHINYGKRGADSDADEELVRTWCKQHAIPLEVYRVTDKADAADITDRLGTAEASSFDSGRTKSVTTDDALNAGGSTSSDFLKMGNFFLNKGNFQDQARKMRKIFLTTVMKKHRAQGIFLAHHQDDLIETVLLKMLRGASIEKWTGLHVVHYPWIRPLLKIPRENILDYARRHNIPFRIDSTNNESLYARNLLRNDVFPRLDSFFPGWQKNILRVSQSAQLHQSMLDYITTKVTDSTHPAFQRSGSGLRADPTDSKSKSGLSTQVDGDKAWPRVLDRSLWLELPEEMRIPVARNWIASQTGFSEWKRGEVDRLGDLEHIQTGKSVSVNRGRNIIRDRDYFVIVKYHERDIPGNFMEKKKLIEYPVIRIDDIYIYSGLSAARLPDTLNTKPSHTRSKGFPKLLIPDDVPASTAPVSSNTPIASGKKCKISGLEAEMVLIRQSNETSLQPDLLMVAGRFQPEIRTGMLQLVRNRLPNRLILRYWKHGDRIRPLGMQGEQSVARHLVNRGISSAIKKRAIVLVSFDGMILAVIFPHPLENGEMGTISEYARCQKKGEKTLTITQKHKHT